MCQKYKDADPKDTVARIQAIFDAMGIDLNYSDEKHVDGVYTSWLVDSTCHWRTGGKGATPEYCKASAYGEAVEHLSTHYAFDLSTISPSAKSYKGFQRYPDELLLPLERIWDKADDVRSDMEEPYRRLGLPIPSKEALVSLWKQILKSDETPFVPYYYVNRGAYALLPDAVLSKLCGTNGCGSGNSPEEAIGHALDEIVERWCKYSIFSGCLTPPEVPDAYIEKRCPWLLELKSGIEQQGGLKVLVMDASLGRGYPVLLVAILDMQSKRYLVNFGCHPQFEIALERCFTEIFQGRKVVPELLERKEMVIWPNTPRRNVHCQCNWTKLLEDDLGFWPEELFATTPSWAFTPWAEYTDYSNRHGMAMQLEHLQKDGAQVYIRDVSFLGFPVYKVYVAGISISHIDYTEDILEEMKMPGNIQKLIQGALPPAEIRAVGKRLFGDSSILGRMFFHKISIEQFDLLAAAFLLEFGNPGEAAERIRAWTDEEARMISAVLNMSKHVPINRAIDFSKKFATPKTKALMDSFFSELPFMGMLRFYGYHGKSEQSKTGDLLRLARDTLITQIKDYMAAHAPDPHALHNLISTTRERSTE